MLTSGLSDTPPEHGAANTNYLKEICYCWYESKVNIKASPLTAVCQCVQVGVCRGEAATWRSAAAGSPSAALPAETRPSPSLHAQMLFVLQMGISFMDQFWSSCGEQE